MVSSIYCRLKLLTTVCVLLLMTRGSCYSFISTKMCPLKGRISKSLQMSFMDGQPKLDKSLSQQMTIISIVTIGLSIMPLVADATDGSMAIAKVISPILDAFIFAMNFLFVCRTVISWYPKTDLTILPFSAIVWPTEPLLVPVRELVPPAFGVDVSAIVWISLLSFLHEILTGQQGILTLLEKT